MKVSDLYPEVLAMDVTADQQRGLEIEYKQYVQSLRVERDPPPAPVSVGAFLATRYIANVFATVADRFVVAERRRRFEEAESDPVKGPAMAQAGAVDLDVKVPQDEVVVKP